jgi:hypothetical protein
MAFDCIESEPIYYPESHAARSKGLFPFPEGSTPRKARTPSGSIMRGAPQSNSRDKVLTKVCIAVGSSPMEDLYIRIHTQPSTLDLGVS